MHLKETLKKYLAKRRQYKVSIPYKIRKIKTNKKNIVFILPTNKNSKSGGDKVIYRQSQIINDMKICGFTSQILHPYNPGSSLDWFEHNAKIKQDLCFNPDADIVILPEIWAAPHGNLLAKLGVKYAIYVQGGYIIDTPLYLCSHEELVSSYQSASLIMAISNDTAENIKLVFPDLGEKIMRSMCSVSNKKFHQSGKKEKLITYMPRRLARHSNLIRFFIQPRLPKGWKMQPIEGMSEEGVANVLAKSTIFLSFAELEGLGLPPVEAALAGNYVIGYTGQGAKEYWAPEIFTEIENGDIKSFCNAILDKISQIESGNINHSAFTQAREQLVERFSEQSEIALLKLVVEKLDSAF